MAMKMIPKGNHISSPKTQNSTPCQMCTSYIVQYVIKGVITVFSNWNYSSDLVVVQASTSHYEKLPLLKQMSPKLSRYLIFILKSFQHKKSSISSFEQVKFEPKYWFNLFYLSSSQPMFVLERAEVCMPGDWGPAMPNGPMGFVFV